MQAKRMISIREVMEKYKIKPNRIMLCGINEGSTIALKAAFQMYREFAGVLCLSPMVKIVNLMMDLNKYQQ